MSGFRVIYKVDGIEYLRVFEYSSSASEAAKMVELSAKWKDLHCDVEIISVHDNARPFENNQKNSQKEKSFKLSFDGREPF